MLVISVAEVPMELQSKFLELKKELKAKYDIDLLGAEVGAVMELFDIVFRPLLTEFQEDKITVDDVAVKLIEYSERMTLLSSVVKYAQDRYKTDFREAAFFKVLEHNLDGATKHILELNHTGKSLEDAYRYMLSQAIVLIDEGKSVQ
jgi:hypothetical protein